MFGHYAKRKATAEFMAHYHSQRNHQGLATFDRGTGTRCLSRTLVPELTKTPIGTDAELRGGELIDAEHGYISLSVGPHGPFWIAQD